VTVDGYEVLTPDEAAKLDQEYGSQFGWGDRLFGSFDDDTVSLAYSIEARDLATMLAADGNARKIERVLSLPVRGAPWHITGTGPAANLIRDNLTPMLGKLIEQCTGAIVYRRAYFEKVWTVNPDGRFIYQKLAWRPPQSCTPRFDRQTGVEQGFYQRITDSGWWVGAHYPKPGEGIPGQVTIERNKAFVYTHGRHREPIKGVSDLEVAYNAYGKKAKLKFLWGQYLENQSLPKLLAYGRDAAEAQKNAQFVGQARASGIIPAVRVEGDTACTVEPVESSGRGADQFIEAIRYYDWEQTNSVLAGFTELASSASSGVGSYALSADQSEFFLQSEQALADDIADQIVECVFTPLVQLNFGVDAEVPGLTIGPIGNRQTDRALSLLESIVSSTRPNVPMQFVGFLLNQVAESMGLDTGDVADIVERWGTDMQAELQAAQAAQVAAASQPKPDRNPSAQAPLEGIQTAQNADPAPAPAGVYAMKAPARHPKKRGRR
jgi:hypothetical protein